MVWLIIFLAILIISIVVFAIFTAKNGNGTSNTGYLEYMSRRHMDYFNNPIVEYMKRQNKD